MGNVLTGLIVIAEENNGNSSYQNSEGGSTQQLSTGNYAKITDIQNFQVGKKLKDVTLTGEGLNNVKSIQFNDSKVKFKVGNSNTEITLEGDTEITEDKVSHSKKDAAKNLFTRLMSNRFFSQHLRYFLLNDND